MSDMPMCQYSSNPPSPIEFSTSPPTGDHVKKPLRSKGIRVISECIKDESALFNYRRFALFLTFEDKKRKNRRVTITPFFIHVIVIVI